MADVIKDRGKIDSFCTAEGKKKKKKKVFFCEEEKIQAFFNDKRSLKR